MPLFGISCYTEIRCGEVKVNSTTRDAEDSAFPVAAVATVARANQKTSGFPEKQTSRRGFRKKRIVNSESETPDTEGRDEVGCRWMLEFQKGDDSAFERLVLHYQGSVEHFLYRYLSDRDRTQDLTQEVFVRVFRSRRRYVPSASFKTWLFTIATRLAFNEIRGIRRRRRIFRESSDAEPGTGEPRELQADPRQISPEAKVEHDELESIVDELIEELPDKQKAALVLSRVEQL